MAKILKNNGSIDIIFAALIEATGNNTRLLAEIEDCRFTSFEESIVKLCEFYRENIDMIDDALL